MFVVRAQAATAIASEVADIAQSTMNTMKMMKSWAVACMNTCWNSVASHQAGVDLTGDHVLHCWSQSIACPQQLATYWSATVKQGRLPLTCRPEIQ